jgi:putative addiction module component (TIGR02574 family)
MILDLLPDVQKLPPAEKRQLAEELLQSVEESDEVEVSPEILSLLESRLAAYDADPSAVTIGTVCSIPWKSVELSSTRCST